MGVVKGVRGVGYSKKKQGENEREAKKKIKKGRNWEYNRKEKERGNQRDCSKNCKRKNQGGGKGGKGVELEGKQNLEKKEGTEE